MSTIKKAGKYIGLHSVLGISMLAVLTPAQAADTPTPTEEIVVTGSRIKRTDVEGPSPVVTFSSEDMVKKGFTNVQEAISSLTQSSGGQLDQQQTFGFTPSASAVDIRGFGIGRTLVLVDGRRLPVFPLAAGGTTNFVDLSSIPAAAIERIEILTDGASAIYGSDAISGVVNVILRKSLDANSLSLRYGDTSGGGAETSRMQMALGSSSEKTDMMTFLEYFDRGVLMAKDRERTQSDKFGGIGAYSSYSYPGNFFTDDDLLVAPDCPLVDGGLCSFDRSAWRQSMAPLKRYSVSTKLDHRLNDELTLFGRVDVVHSNVRTQLEPTAFDMRQEGMGQIGIGAANNPTVGANDPSDRYVDAAGHFRRRLVEWGPRVNDTDTDMLNFLTGIKGTFGDSYEWELGYNYARQSVDAVSGGAVDRDALRRELCGNGDDCNNGSLNLFNRASADVVQRTLASSLTDGQSTVSTLDFQLSGEMFDLPAGPAQFATALEYTRSTYSDQRSPDVINGNVISQGGTTGEGSRKYYAGGLEMSLPLLDNLTANLAGRYDYYDDATEVGGNFSPKLSLEFRPMDTLLLRASAAESFRAPDLQRLFGGQTAAFGSLIDTEYCRQLGGSGRGDARVPACVNQVESVNMEIGSNVNLKAEEGKSYNVGMVFEPIDNLSFNVDVWSLKLDQIVSTPDVQYIMDNSARYPGSIERDPTQAGPQNAGGLTLVRVGAQNLAFQNVQGIDFGSQYTFALGDMGDLTTKLGGTYTTNFETKATPESEVVDEINDSIGRLNTVPEWKGNLSFAWAKDEWSASAFIDYIGAFTPTETSFQKRIDSWTRLNTNVAYSLPWEASVQLGINNVMDKEPPRDFSGGRANSWPYYNQGYHDVMGRAWYLEYKQSF